MMLKIQKEDLEMMFKHMGIFATLEKDGLGEEFYRLYRRNDNGNELLQWCDLAIHK